MTQEDVEENPDAYDPTEAAAEFLKSAVDPDTLWKALQQRYVNIYVIVFISLCLLPLGCLLRCVKVQITHTQAIFTKTS